jgi:hypothetical protein
MMKKFAISMTSALALTLVSCTPYQGQGALLGGAAGALAGAAFGDDHQDVIAGAAVGAGLGAGAAAVHENSVRQRQGAYQRGPQQPRSSSSGNYPTAQRSTTPGRVLSPYPPHNEIDVTGFASGSLVKDPNTGEIFRVP